jgi:FG-GAP-like repeat
MHTFSVRFRSIAAVICLLVPVSAMASGFPTPLPKFPVGPLPAGVAVGDFNSDDKLDLVFVHQACDTQPSSTITVVLGRGNGTFRAPVTSSAPFCAAAAGPVFVGDFNGDHKLDIAFSGGNGFCVSLGRGDGTFGSTVNYPDPGPGPIGVGDLNGDGKLDVVFSGSDFFLGRGNGIFRLVKSTLPLDFACSLADINGDGKLDLIGSAAIELGIGNAMFGVAVSIPNSTGICPAIADFNGDGKLDLAIPAPVGVALLFGNGDGTFQSPVTFNVGILMNLGSGSLLAADFNGDGKPDLFIKQNQYVGTILLNTGKGRFSGASAASYQFSELTDYFLGDFNGDGRTDVVSVGFGFGSQFFSRIALASPNGTLPLPRTYFAHGTGEDTLSVTAGDFNGDGKLDLAVVAPNLGGSNMAGELSVLLGKGSGIFGHALAGISGGASSSFVTAADLNKDGKMDVVVASSNVVSVRLGLGNGIFQKAINYPAQGATSIAIADFNGDGIPDLAVNSVNFAGTLPGQVLLGNGDGTFRTSPTLLPGARSLATADFNHDGKQDLAIGTSSGVGIMLGDGDGNFQPMLILRKGQGGSLVVADFNNDGVPDVAGVGANTSGQGVVSVYLGDGKGISAAKKAVIAAQGVLAAASADFNADGNADLAVTTYGGIVGLLRGKGTGYFKTAIFYPEGLADGIVAADLDGNGTPDLAVTTSIGNSVTVLLNEP